MNLPEWLVLWVCQSLIGEIYPEIRAIVLGYDDDKNLIIRYYLDREPTEDDFESLECVVTNIFAHTSSDDQICGVTEEAIFSLDRLGDLDVLDGLVYARKEFFSED